ncbi:MAG: hypothetical protein AMJ63_09055 [Myxococcales bacterium SG8_38_1]|jgi:uncharacterized membrane protein HdeD (DUF308 family)|nr:MAG: hypothetical protein AMJ63_09055 [Myxococcales bacterium SG8_38_1]
MANEIEAVDAEMLGTIKRHAGVGMLVGILVAIAGILALVAPLAAGLSVAIAVGVLLMVSGVSRVFLAFKMGSFGHGLLMFVIGLLSALAGLYMVARPGMALATITIVLAAYFIVDGVFQIIWALRLRPIQGWGWTLFSGVVALALGIMIWRQFPVSGVWAVGTLAGIQMIFGGSSIASVCSAAKRAAADTQAA